MRSGLCEQQLRPRLADLTASAPSEPVVVRFDCILPEDLDPWALALDPASERARADLPWLLWNDPRDGTRFAALGVTREVRCGAGEAPAVFGAAEAAWRDLVASLRPLGDSAGFEQLPVLLGGFAFDVAREPAGPWQGWPAGRLWLPQVLVAYMHGRVTATVFAERREPEATAATLLEQARRVDACVDAFGARWQASMVAPGEVSLPAPLGLEAQADESERDAWLALVEAARETVRTGGAHKLVVARSAMHRPAAEAAHTPFDALATAVALRESQPGCVTFAVQPGGGCDGAAFVGATPETLLRLGGRIAESQALAGTGPVGDDALFERAKDRHEQHLVVEAVVAALQPWARTVEADREPQVARFANVQHLSTRVHAWLERETNVFPLLAALHPTPAVNGWPRETALAWLRAHEGLERGWFAGPLGWVNPLGDGTWMVALRSALMGEAPAWTFAGAGVVAESDPQAEWVETQWKMRAATAALCASEAPVSREGHG